MANSISEFGFKQPIVVDSNYTIIVGDTRYQAALKLGLEEVPVIVADDLTDEQVRAYRLADNKVGEVADWDFDLLVEEMDEIFGFDMSDFGFLDASVIDWADVPELTEKTYETPKKKELKCPKCEHIDDARNFGVV